MITLQIQAKTKKQLTNSDIESLKEVLTGFGLDLKSFSQDSLEKYEKQKLSISKKNLKLKKDFKKLDSFVTNFWEDTVNKNLSQEEIENLINS
jgi:pyruvate-formate lyase-activating enzyme